SARNRNEHRGVQQQLRGVPKTSAIIFLVNAIIRYLRPGRSESSNTLVFCRGPAIALVAAISFTIASRKNGGVEVLHLSGCLTPADGTSALREAARSAFDRVNVLLDFSALTYIDSAGLGRTGQRARLGEFPQSHGETAPDRASEFAAAHYAARAWGQNDDITVVTVKRTA